MQKQGKGDGAKERTNQDNFDFVWYFEIWSKDEIEQLNSALSIAETNKDIATEDDYDEDREFDTNYTQFMKVLDHGTKIPTPFESVEKEPKVNSKWAPIEEVASVGGLHDYPEVGPYPWAFAFQTRDISAMSMLGQR